MKLTFLGPYAALGCSVTIVACSQPADLSRLQYAPSIYSVPPVRDSSSYGLLYTFGGALRSDGSNPYAPLVLVNYYAYGTTETGGTYRGGTVFELMSGSKDTVLHSFGGGSDGSLPQAGLINVNGTLYGTAFSGGMYSGGTVFSIAPDGTNYKVVYNFGKGADASGPRAGLIDVGGTLYGTTSNGGIYGFGTVFRMTTTGTNERVLHSFGYKMDGRRPYAKLTNVSNTLYSTTPHGGTNNNNGTIFSIATNGTNYKLLHSFGKGTDGSQPTAGFVDVGGTLYGTTTLGGTHCVTSGGTGCGTVFTLTTAGKESVLFDFNGFDGNFPDADLTNISGTLYGTTGGGGTGGGYGTIFSLTRGGKQKVLHTFGFGSDGKDPNAMIDDSGILIGTTISGGAYGDGTAFYLML